MSSPSLPTSSTSSDTPRSSLSRPTSRRTLRSFPSSDGSTDNPLFGASPPSSTPASGGGTGPYAVYSGTKKRASLLGGVPPPFPSSASSTPLSPSESPLSPPPSSAPTPPFAPTTASPSLPPLVSRPSNSTLPSFQKTRAAARSVSEAKEQLQRQALKSELQGLGLGVESVGHALVQRVAGLEGGKDWEEVVKALGSGKVTLLLPAEKLDSSTTTLTPSFLLDHLILLGPTARDYGFATLSGLRGYLSTDELVFTSCGTAVGAADATLDFSDDVVQRSLLGPLPSPNSPPQSTYPSTMLISAITPLSIPHSRSTSAATPPPPTSRTTSRLAALFAKPLATPPAGDDLPPVVPAPAGLFEAESTPGPSLSKHVADYSLSVVAVGKAVRRAEVIAGIAEGVEAQLRGTTRSIEGVDGEAPVLEHVAAFAHRLQPPSSTPADPSTPSTSLFSAEVDETSGAFQDALHAVRLDLTRNLGAAPPTPSLTSTSAPSMEDFSVLEDRVDASLAELENVVTSVLYDRLYSPPAPLSTDGNDDESLCSRIAALNVLELDLDHLGLELGDAETGLEGWERESRSARETLEELAGRVGKELDRLEDPQERTPSAKLAILVECHAVLVDGLSKLPPVPLKKELSSDDRSSLSERPAEVEMDDASSRASSQPPSRPRSPTPTADDELLKTPKPPVNVDGEVPEIKLPDSSSNAPLSFSTLDATTTSLFEPASNVSSPPASVFESSRRSPSTASTSTSSADLILPLLIYSVVRANPPHLVSHLNYIQRFRSDSLLRGQGSYCLTNFSAIVEFVTNIDVSALGISSQKIIGVDSSSPSPSPALSTTSSPPASASLSPVLGRPRAHTTGHLLRGRVSHELGNLAGGGAAALAGVVDSSYRLIFSGAKGAAGAVGGAAPRSLEEVKSVLEGARGRARDSLPFRRSMSTRTVAGEVPSALSTATEGSPHREMVDIAPTAPGGTPDVVHDAYAPPPAANSAPPLPAPPLPPRHVESSSASSVRSISSLLKDSTIGRALGEVREGVTAQAAAVASTADDRLSLSERFAGLSLPGVGRFGSSSATSPAGSRRATLLNPITPASVASSSSAASTAAAGRFLEVESAAELRIGEVQLLLEEYKRMAKRLAELETQVAAGGIGEGEGDATTPTA